MGFCARMGCRPEWFGLGWTRGHIPVCGDTQAELLEHVCLSHKPKFPRKSHNRVLLMGQNESILILASEGDASNLSWKDASNAYPLSRNPQIPCFNRLMVTTKNATRSSRRIQNKSWIRMGLPSYRRNRFIARKLEQTEKLRSTWVVSCVCYVKMKIAQSLMMGFEEREASISCSEEWRESLPNVAANVDRWRRRSFSKTPRVFLLLRYVSCLLLPPWLRGYRGLLLQFRYASVFVFSMHARWGCFV